MPDGDSVAEERVRQLSLLPPKGIALTATTGADGQHVVVAYDVGGRRMCPACAGCFFRSWFALGSAAVRPARAEDDEDDFRPDHLGTGVDAGSTRIHRASGSAVSAHEPFIGLKALASIDLVTTHGFTPFLAVRAAVDTTMPVLDAGFGLRFTL